jgi:acyl-CoA reductase-like NAD-dependent aldehyde dehydrogenase
MKILNEETLAPILPVMSYQDTEEICEWVNGITQAHSGAIFSKTANEAIALGDKLSIPYLSINDIALEEVLQVGQHPQMTPETLEFEGTFSNYKKFFRKKTFIINTHKPFGTGWIKS